MQDPCVILLHLRLSDVIKDDDTNIVTFMSL